MHKYNAARYWHENLYFVMRNIFQKAGKVLAVQNTGKFPFPITYKCIAL